MMDGSRGVFHVGTIVRKVYERSRFRHPPQVVPRSEWPVITAARPLFYLIRLFGLVPFGISQDNFVPGSCDVIYSIFCTLAHTYALYCVLNKFSMVEERATAILDITETAKVIFNYCVAILNVLVALWTRKEFIGVLNIVKHFDSRMRDLGHSRREGAAIVWVWITGVCTAVLWIIVNRTGMKAFGESWVDNVAYILNYIATWLSTVKFSSTVLLLGQRFRHLNRVAQHSKESTIIKKKYIPVNYKVIQQLHNSLMIAGESLSSQYEWPLLLWLMNLCVHSVSNLYFLIDWLMSTTDREVTRWSLVNCITWWLVTCVIQLLLIHFTCHLTSAEANSMGPISMNWKSLSFRRNYEVESCVHLVNRKLNFSAAGCFHVNLPLLSSITALLTTYLVLLLQFKA